MKKVEVLTPLISPFCNPSDYAIAPTLLPGIYPINDVKNYPKDGGWLGEINYLFAIEQEWIREIDI